MPRPAPGPYLARARSVPGPGQAAGQAEVLKRTCEIVLAAIEHGMTDSVASFKGEKTDLLEEPDIMTPPGATCGPLSADKVRERDHYL